MRELPRWLSPKESAYQAGDMGSIPGSGRFPGEGNGNSLQYSYLANLMDREACWLYSMGWQKVRHDLATKQQQKMFFLWTQVGKKCQQWKYFYLIKMKSNNGYILVFLSLWKDLIMKLLIYLSSVQKSEWKLNYILIEYLLKFLEWFVVSLTWSVASYDPVIMYF